MEIIRLEEGLGEAVIKAAGVLRRGGIIVYPTDTLYGLGADALSDEVVARMHAIKGSDPAKPTHCVVANLAMAEKYVEVNDAARKIAEKFLPGPLTLILNKKPGVEGGIASGMGTFAIRIPDNEFCIELAKTLGRPYTATSANKNGVEPAMTVEKIVAQLDSGKGIDLAIDAGLAPRAKPSTIINLVSGHPSILREGAIPSADILALF